MTGQTKMEKKNLKYFNLINVEYRTNLTNQFAALLIQNVSPPPLFLAQFQNSSIRVIFRAAVLLPTLKVIILKQTNNSSNHKQNSRLSSDAIFFGALPPEERWQRNKNSKRTIPSNALYLEEGSEKLVYKTGESVEK